MQRWREREREREIERERFVKSKLLIKMRIGCSELVQSGDNRESFGASFVVRWGIEQEKTAMGEKSRVDVVVVMRVAEDNNKCSEWRPSHCPALLEVYSTGASCSS